MGMMVIKLGEEEGDREALERELPAVPSSTYPIHVSLEEGGDFDEELIIGFHPQMDQHTSYRGRSRACFANYF